MSEGWWNIKAGDCSTPIGGDLKNRFYYYLAKSKGWSFEDENFRFCTTSKAFTINGDEECTGRGYLYAREPDSGEYYCYAIDTIDQFSMTLMYLPGGISWSTASWTDRGRCPGLPPRSQPTHITETSARNQVQVCRLASCGKGTFDPCYID